MQTNQVPPPQPPQMPAFLRAAMLIAGADVVLQLLNVAEAATYDSRVWQEGVAIALLPALCCCLLIWHMRQGYTAAKWGYLALVSGATSLSWLFAEEYLGSPLTTLLFAVGTATTVLAGLGLLHPLTTRWFQARHRMRTMYSMPLQKDNAMQMLHWGLVWLVSPLVVLKGALLAQLSTAPLAGVLGAGVPMVLVGCVLLAIGAHRLRRLKLRGLR